MHWFGAVLEWMGNLGVRRGTEALVAMALPVRLFPVGCATMVLALAGCNGVAKVRPGSLVIATQTDMSVPGGIDTIELRVDIAGELRHEESFEVAPVGEQKVPFVYELEASEEPPGEVTISVVGLKEGEARVFAQTVTTFPEDERTAIIELPLQWLCTGQVEQNDDGEYASSCAPIREKAAACVAGECQVAVVDPRNLRDYTPQDVFGGAAKPGSDGACFPTEVCFDSPTVVVPNGDCQVELEGSDQHINIALQLPQDLAAPSSGPGICNSSGCFVPLDNDSETGYTFLAALDDTDGGVKKLHIGLPDAVCSKLEAGELVAVVASAACETKTSRIPTCGEWSSTTNVVEVVLESSPGDAAADAMSSEASSPVEAGTDGEITIVAQGDNDGGAFVVGDSIQLVLVGTDSEDVLWESSNENVATVTSDGLVTIVGPGDATITALVDGKTVEFHVTGVTRDAGSGEIDVGLIASVTFVMLDPTEAMIPTGASVDVSARGTLQDGSTIIITSQAEWSSSDETIATVVDGHVVGLQPGEVTIAAKANDVVGEANIRVTDETLELLTVEPSELTLPVGLAEALVATGTYTNGQSLMLSADAEWTSGNEDVVRVDSAGLVTAIAVGETLVTAQLDGKTDTAFIRVTDATLESISVAPSPLSLYVGQQRSIVATALYSDGQTHDVSTQMTWSSDAEDIATVTVDSLTGVHVSGTGEGDATVMGTFGDEEVAVPVAVTSVPLTGLMLAPPAVSLPLGATTALALVANYADGKSVDARFDATWLTDNPEVATILDDGTVVAQSVGTAQISATVGELTATSVVTVTDARLLGVSLTPTTLTINAGLRSEELIATASYSDGHSERLTTNADWSSSTTAVVVDEMGAILANTPGTATVTVSFGGESDTALVTVEDAQVESLRIVSAETSVPAGNTLQLRADATYTNGSTEDVTANVVWRTGNGEVGRVDAAGLFTGQAAGEVTVSATFGEQSASLPLSVTSALPINIVLTPDLASLPIGTTRLLSAMIEYSDGTSRAPGAAAEWTSDDQAVATVTEGLVEGVGEGFTDVVVTVGGLEGRATIEVTSATPTQLAVTPSAATVAEGELLTFSALVTYSDDISTEVTAGVTWRSLTPDIATVNPNTGVVLAIAPGTASIEGTFGTLVDSATFAVMEATVETLSITPESASVARGNPTQFAAVATYTNGVSRTVTAVAGWSSEDTGVATINDAGVARGEAPGTATITASFGGQSGSAVLTVTDAELTGLSVLPAEASVPAGNTQRFIAEAEYSDGTSVAVSPIWTTSASEVATITAQGEALGRRRGEADIIASFGGLQAEATLTVTNAVVVGLLIAPSNPAIPAGTTLPFTVTATYSDGTTGPIQATFTSSNTQRLQINSATGLATGVAAGNVTVTATAQGLSSSTTAQVTSGRLEGLVVTPNARSVPLGNQVALAANATYTDGRTIVVTTAAGWSTSNANVATVQDGVVTTRGRGTAIITAAFNGATANSTITVTDAVVTAIAVELVQGTSTSAPLGQAIALQARATYSDGSAPVVTASWTATNGTGSFTVNASGSARALTVGQATVTATFSGFSGSLVLTATDAVVVGMALEPTSVNLIIGTTRQLVARATYSDGSPRDVTASAVWTTGDGYIARVTAGLVSGTGPGSATIRATFGGVTATAPVTVAAASVTSVTVTSPTGTSVPAGLTRNLVATAAYDNGTQEDVTFEATWSSSNVTFLTVSDSVATGRAVGNVTVTASFAGVDGTLPMSVTAAQLTGLRMDPTSVEMAAGRSDRVRLVGSYTDGSEQDLTSLAIWTSDDSEVASYEAGQVFGGISGSATIEATTGGLSATLPVTISDAVVDSITVVPEEGNVPAGNSVQLRAEANYSNGRTEDVTAQATWLSGMPTAATVSGGLVRGLLAGNSVSISATFGGPTGTATITVTNAVVTRVVVEPSTASIPAGTTRQLVARAIYSNGNETVVTNTATWARTSGTSVSLSATGLVRGDTLGSSVVSATFNQIAGSSTITVTDAIPSGVTLTPAEGTVIVGTTIALTARQSYTDGRTEVVNTRATWTSSNGTRTSVSNGVVTGLVAGTEPVTITATVDGFSATASIVVVAASITSINVTVAESSSVPVGLTRQLSATATYNNGTSRDVTAEAIWGSSSPTVLTVARATGSSVAVATGRAVGTANATATIGSIAGNASMRVTSAVVQGVRISPTQLNLIDGQRGNVQLFAVMSGGTEQNVTSSTTTTWESENADVASVGSGGNVSANGSGQVRIYGNYQGFRASANITVTQATITEIRVTLGSNSIPAGTTTSVEVQALWNNGTTSDETDEAEWTSSNVSRATVVDTNLGPMVQAGRQTGEVTLTATVSGVSGSAALTVTTATVSALVVTPATRSLVEGTSVQLQATATFSDGSSTTVTGEEDTSWSTSDDEVASMQRTRGLFSANEAGQATITATYRGRTATASLTVTAPVVVGLRIVPSEFTLESDRQLQLEARGELNNGDETDLTSLVTWGTSDPYVLSIGNNAVVTALLPGEAQISATYDKLVAESVGTVPDNRPRYSELRMCPGSLTIPVGGTYGLAVMGLSEDGYLEDISNLVSWKSGDENLSVDEDGIIRAAKPIASTSVAAEYLESSVEAQISAQDTDGIYLEADPPVVRVTTGGSAQLRVSLVRGSERVDVTTGALEVVVNNNEQASVGRSRDQASLVVQGKFPPGCTFVRISYQQMYVDVPISVSGPIEP
jgi:uncharacterized protein YjdB